MKGRVKTRCSYHSRALATNCCAELNEKGAMATNWKDGKPVRVVSCSVHNTLYKSHTSLLISAGQKLQSWEAL